MRNFSILVPCYNCEKIIEKNNKRLINKIQKKKINYEIIYINDGSTDNSLNKLKNIELQNKKISLISYNQNLGKSAALKKGIQKSKNDILIFLDCDLPYFQYLDKLINKLILGNEFVFIDRRSIKSKLDKSKLNFYQILRFITSKLVNYIISKLLIKNFKGDTQSGLKGFKIDRKFKKQNFISNKFFLDAEIMSYYSKKNVKFYSIPINYKIPKVSTIKIFDFNNFRYLLELSKIILKF